MLDNETLSQNDNFSPKYYPSKKVINSARDVKKGHDPAHFLLKS